ncbi:MULTISPECIES: MarR family winged helix-turn-helix transcriptional regulator [Pseudomonas]|uniref:MarR family winged helix-turn-helix transcriptional regulator n=1 Tax=Pseudomonas TaxID=286 RepID=UPI001F2BBDCF|nr:MULTISPECIES: MarR family transcriptional regulator [Pseudomonas]MDW3712415.1 MarR family transcriptional regulator [Pseudomonas sp. 2023EL-01195]
MSSMLLFAGRPNAGARCRCNWTTTGGAGSIPAHRARELPMVIDRKIKLDSADIRRLDDLDVALELLHFGFRGLTLDADAYLETLGLSRVHHRILYAIRRVEGINVGELAALLGVSKQALHRPLTHLFERALVTQQRDPEQHRYKRLSLSPEGHDVERRATDLERQAIRAALDTTDTDGRVAWHSVMQSLAARLD